MNIDTEDPIGSKRCGQMRIIKATILRLGITLGKEKVVVHELRAHIIIEEEVAHH